MIRWVEERDLNEVRDLLLQVQDVHANGRPDIFIKGGRKYTDEEIIALMHDDSMRIFVYTDEEDKVVGYCFTIIQQHLNSTNMTPIKTLYIDDLCVDEGHRHQHIGEALLNHVEAYARENGFHNMTLNVWACNPSAMGFYQKMGLEVLKIGMERVLK